MSLGTVVEFVQFRPVDGTDESDFIAASDAMIPELEAQEGFMGREFLKGEDGLWMDVI